MDACLQSSWEDVALEMNVSSAKRTDVTYKIHQGYLAAQLPWLINLARFVCDVDQELSIRVSALHSMVTGLISSGGDHGIRC